MWFEIDLSGVRVMFRVTGYRATDKNDWDSAWCSCDFSFSFGNCLDYHRENCEVLLASEIDELEREFSKLLAGELSNPEDIVCVEPDFVFKLYPQRDLKDYSQCGCPVQDIYLEWRIYFWDGDITENYFSLTFGREDIERFRDYLSSVIKRGSCF